MTAAPTPPPLTPQQMEQLAQARIASQRLRRAAGVASGDGWTIIIFAVLTLLGTLACGPLSLDGILVGAALLIVGIVERKGADALRRLDPEAPRRLCLNQLALAGILILYALWNLMAAALGHTSDLAKQVSSVDPNMAQQIEGMQAVITRLVYCGLIVVAILAQGGLALYYHRRGKMLREYLAATPAWILQMQRAGVGV